MAEFVQFRLEEMRPELEQYAKYEIFDGDQIREITIARKELEYKIHKHSKSKNDFLKYIQYEVDLLKLLRLKLRFIKIQENVVRVKRELCRFIVRRVMCLFFFSVSKFPEDIKMWLTFIKFCKVERKFSEVSKNLERMLKFHGDKEEMWKIAAHWEYAECQNIETARGFLLTGMRHHPESEYIYSEAFWLELKYAEQLRLEAIREAKLDKKVANLEENIVMKGGLARIMYETALEKINSCQFLCTMLKIALDFEFASDLQDSIKKNLTENFAEDPKTWLTFAQLELECYTLEGELSVAQLYRRRRGKVNSPSIKQIEHANSILNAAVHDINTEEMWTQYIDVFLTFLENADKKKGNKKIVRELLKEAMEDAHMQAKLAANLYRHYVDLLGNDENAVLEVLSTATDRHPNSLELWIARLKFSFYKDEKKETLKIFQLAIKEFNGYEEMLELWLLMTSESSVDEKFLNNLFKLALNVKSNVADKIKIMHLNHVYSTKGLAACRSLYNQVSITPPFSLPLHQRIIELETQQPKIDPKQIRKCFEMACVQFGPKDAGLWMDYINFELEHGSKPLTTALYMRATKSLESKPREGFMEMYSKLQSSVA